MVRCYEELTGDLEAHVQDMDTLAGIPAECVPADYRTQLATTLHQWDVLYQTANEKQVPLH